MNEARYCQEFGKLFKKHRIEMGKTLREFCRDNGFDHGNISRMERGRQKPPTGESLDRYLAALRIQPQSDLWYEFRDVAAACAGEVPERLMEDEDVVQKLPAVFKTLARKRPTREELDKLMDLLRRT